LRDWLKCAAGWLFFLALMALPSCHLRSGFVAGGNLGRGPLPHGSAIFCDIENRAIERRCATATDTMVGIRMAAAAIALVREDTSNIGLDYSPAARAALGCGEEPVAIEFLCPFPEGCAVCINCESVIGPSPAPYPDVLAACVDHCEDINGDVPDETPPTPEVAAFCASTDHARVSTNTSGCVAGACLDAGSLRTDFVDPRRALEPVEWTDLVGTAADTNTLTRTAATSVPSDFDAGAASLQTIAGGDGWVEFTAVQTDHTRMLGLATGASPDADPTLNDIDFAISLSSDGHVFIVEGGTVVPGPNPDQSFVTYASGDRFRVKVTDNFDGTAEVTYFYIPAVCAEVLCDGVPLRVAGPGTYPLRVDASLREVDAALDNVLVVRIK
jgi:hypothetical protein